jgi:hypothetical protein
VTAQFSAPPRSVEPGSDHAVTAVTIAALAAAGGLLVWFFGWRGVDMPAQQYNLHIFKAFGWSIWDIGWYGGHSVLTYSTLFPALARVLGMHLTAIVSAAGASWAFDHLLVERYGTRARAGSVVFALGTMVPAIVGQLPFLLGEALGLACLLALVRRRPVLAALAGLGCALASPVAGAFLVLAAAAFAVHVGPGERVPPLVVAGLTATPSLLIALEFGTPGVFPLPWIQLAAILAIAFAVLVLQPRTDRALRAGAALYGVAAIAAFVVPNAMGGNVGRLVMSVGGALAVGVACAGRRVLWGLIAIPLIIWQWAPLMSGGVHRGTYPPATAAYYAPLVARLQAHDLSGRLEIPLTASHWEAAFVAPSVPLARGWERQQDVVVNPLFYRNTPFTSEEYKQWLDDSGVAWVALPDAPLDGSAKQEAAIIRSHPSYLRPVWHDAHWQLFNVVGSPGLVTGPAQLVSVRPDHVVLRATGAGQVTLRMRFTSHWSVRTDNACRQPTPDGWTHLTVYRPGTVELGVGLLRGGDGPGC